MLLILIKLCYQFSEGKEEEEPLGWEPFSAYISWKQQNNILSKNAVSESLNNYISPKKLFSNCTFIQTSEKI